MPPKAFKPPRPSNASSRSNNNVPPRQSNASHDFSSSSSPTPSLGARRSSTGGARRSVGNADDPMALIVDQPPLLPTPLLTRLLQQHFQDPATKISKDANLLMAKYLDTFVREALARAKAEMEEKRGGQGGDFLEVEDLEKLAPQLCLDF